MEFTTPIQKVYMVGPIYGKRLEKLGIKTVEDLLCHFPHRYEDYSLISKISQVQAGETVTLRGTVTQMKNEYTKTGKKIQKAVVSDGTDSMEIVWFNQPFLVKTIKVGENYSFSGKADWFGHKVVMVSPEYEKLTSRGENGQRLTTIHTGRLVPIYPETYGVSSKWLRSRIAPLLRECSNSLFEYLPSSILAKNQLFDYKNAICQIHFPDNKSLVELAKKRLAFDELFLIQLASLKRKLEWGREVVGQKLFIDQEKILKFIASLPFRLTAAQVKTSKEILSDLEQNKPMNRLLEGDVGSGKTVVAAIGMYVVFLNGLKSALMAPTEILASQHFVTLETLLSPFGMKVKLRTGSRKDKGDFDVLVGTHALLSEKLQVERIGLVVIDEQHRFGVEQRAKLREKGGNPHLLTMTATPIPRTVALTLYGELDLSFLDEMPEGRIKVKTWVVPPEKRSGAYGWIRKHVKGTREQAFIICPLIEESETLTSVRAATKEYEHLQKEVFPDLRLGLLHGRMKSKEKDTVLGNFRAGNLDILVATPVVEVGIDIPNATIMMIEGAERFGLAQLHQLRGRVGRGVIQSYCLLFSESENVRRLKAMEKMYVGAQLAELDLKIRGPGEIYGTAQHGIPDLRVASLTDLALIEKTREAAQQVIGQLEQFPLLKQKLEKYTIKSVSPD
ncbi:ATP-dependent DNA helicase RecG [Candidatus Gottesmanbacteria bacterium]|nr:ATP-dependent DNA helicase RecG [Candidatus Gottesmanbacteria bacterium]